MQKRKFTVKKQLNGPKKFRTWDNYAVGDVVIGTYIGNYHCQYEKSNPMIKVLDAQFKDGTGEEYLNQTLVLNECGSLRFAIEDVEIGETIQVEYSGKTKMTKGKFKDKEAHGVQLCTVDVEIEEAQDATASL